MNQSVIYFQKLNSVFIEAKYLFGVPNLNNSFLVEFKPDKFGINFNDAKTGNNRFYLNKNDLIKISVEDKNTIESRVGFKRLLMVGIFAFAWKKRKKIALSYLVFEFKNEFGERQEMYIQSEKPNGFQDFTNIKYNIQKFWQEAEINPNFETEHQLFVTNNHLSENRKNIRIAIAILVIASILYVYNNFIA